MEDKAIQWWKILVFGITRKWIFNNYWLYLYDYSNDSTLLWECFSFNSGYIHLNYCQAGIYLKLSWLVHLGYIYPICAEFIRITRFWRNIQSRVSIILICISNALKSFATIVLNFYENLIFILFSTYILADEFLDSVCRESICKFVCHDTGKPWNVFIFLVLWLR